MSKILIKNGYLIDPKSQREGNFDLLIEGKIIKAIEKRGGFGKIESSQVIDAEGSWVVPGLVDLHVHLREPGFEWKETVLTGSRAAVLGGYTTVCCMPNTNPVNDTAQVTEFILEKARAANLCRVLPIGAVSLSSKGKQMAPLSELRKAGCVAFSDDGEPIYDAGLMRRALEWCRMLDATISCHEEDKSLTCGGCMNESALSLRLGLRGMPSVGEDVMVARDIELARYTKGRVHICHISTARSIELVRRAKNDGFRVTCEVTPHHLTLTEDRIEQYDTNAKMSPPLREAADVAALIEGLKDGTVDAIASDHAPHELDSKQKEFSEASFGILGLQSSLSLIMGFVADKKITPLRAIEALSTGPARAFGLEAGALSAGSQADIAIIDPEKRWNFDKQALASLSKNSPFFGREMLGVTTHVLVGGRSVMKDGELIHG